MFQCCQCRDNLCLLIIEEYSIFPWGVLPQYSVFTSESGECYSYHQAQLTRVQSFDSDICFQYSVAVAARTRDDSLGRLSQRVAVKVKPEDVPLNLRGEGVTTHTMRLTWGPPIR